MHTKKWCHNKHEKQFRSNDYNSAADSRPPCRMHIFYSLINFLTDLWWTLKWCFIIHYLLWWFLNVFSVFFWDKCNFFRWCMLKKVKSFFKKCLIFLMQIPSYFFHRAFNEAISILNLFRWKYLSDDCSFKCIYLFYWDFLLFWFLINVTFLIVIKIEFFLFFEEKIAKNRGKKIWQKTEEKQSDTSKTFMTK